MSKINFEESVFITDFNSEKGKTNYDLIDKGFAEFSNNMFANLQEFRNIIEDSAILKDFALKLGLKAPLPLLKLDGVFYDKGIRILTGQDCVTLFYSSNYSTPYRQNLKMKLTLFKDFNKNAIDFDIRYEYDSDENSVSEDHPEYDEDKHFFYFDNEYFILNKEFEKLDFNSNKILVSKIDKNSPNDIWKLSTVNILKTKLLKQYNQFLIDFVDNWFKPNE